MPYSARSLTETEGSEAEKVHGSELSDREIYGQFRLWSSAFTGDVGRRASVIALLGVKTTGGNVLYLSPRVLFDAGAGIVVRAAVQIPIVEHLYGLQDEDPVYNLGFTYDFGNGT